MNKKKKSFKTYSYAILQVLIANIKRLVDKNKP